MFMIYNLLKEICSNENKIINIKGIIDDNDEFLK